MPIFEEIFNELTKNLKDLVNLTVREYKDVALEDGKNFLDSLRDDLERWTKLLANGELTTADLEWLIESKKDLTEMFLLQQAGLAQIRVDKFKNSLVNMITDTILGKVL